MGELARLCEVVQGVQFSVVEQDVTIRALILRDALERYFGADESPDSWLRAYLDNQDTIDTAAADSWRSQHGPALTVLSAERPEVFRFRAHARVA